MYSQRYRTNEYVEVYLLPTETMQMLPEDFCEEHFPKRYQKACGYRSEEDRGRSLAAGTLLWETTGLAEEDILRGPYGKPYAREGRPYFSISHSGDYAAIAVSGSCETGIDIEHVMRKPMRKSLLQRVCTAQEQDWIASAAGMTEEAQRRFYHIWTMKESVCKALGLGLTLPFDSFSVLPLLTAAGTEGNDPAICVEGHAFHGACYDMTEYVLSYVWMP